MLFTSTVFLIFFLPIVLSVNFILPNRFRNLFLLLASILFYAWGEIYYFIIMIVSICCNYILTRAMAQFPAGPSRRSLLIAGVGINLSLLGWFKYANFFVDNLNVALEALSLGRIEIAPVHHST